MLAWLLTTRLGNAAIGLLCVALALGIGFWRGDAHATRVQTARYATALARCADANGANVETIAALKSANASFATSAALQSRQSKVAINQMSLQSVAIAHALVQSQALLNAAEANHGQAHAWAVVRVPAAVADSLRE